MNNSVIQEDFEYVLSHEEISIRSLIDSHLLMTGATGFVGLSVLLPLMEAHKKLMGTGRVTILTRSRQTFYRKHPHFRDLSCLHVLENDIRNVRLVGIAAPDYVIHAATSSAVPQNRSEETDLYNVMIKGQDQLLSELSRYPKFKMLFTSSGAVYRTAPIPIEVPYEEDFTSTFELVESYSSAKLKAEQILVRESMSGAFDITCARLFAFVGPHFPLEEHFAIGNFIGQALRNEQIVVTGDGTATRAYQYSADLARWLVNLLVATDGQEIVNVGSDEAVTISALAELISHSITPHSQPLIRGTSDHHTRFDYYVPNIAKAARVFNLTNQFSLRDSISRTLRHHQEIGVH